MSKLCRVHGAQYFAREWWCWVLGREDQCVVGGTSAKIFRTQRSWAGELGQLAESVCRIYLLSLPAGPAYWALGAPSRSCLSAPIIHFSPARPCILVVLRPCFSQSPHHPKNVAFVHNHRFTLPKKNAPLSSQPNRFCMWFCITKNVEKPRKKVVFFFIFFVFLPVFLENFFFFFVDE